MECPFDQKIKKLANKKIIGVSQLQYSISVRGYIAQVCLKEKFLSFNTSIIECFTKVLNVIIFFSSLDSYTNTHQCWPTNKNLHSSALCRQRMPSRGFAKSDDQ